MAGYNYLKILLTRAGCEVLHASDGIQTVQLVQQIPDIDLVLMDIKMPGMDGYEATRKIKQINPQIIIIAQTAHAMAGDREKVLNAGFDEYISKPIRSKILMDMIRKFFPDEGGDKRE